MLLVSKRSMVLFKCNNLDLSFQLLARSEVTPVWIKIALLYVIVVSESGQGKTYKTKRTREDLGLKRRAECNDLVIFVILFYVVPIRGKGQGMSIR